MQHDPILTGYPLTRIYRASSANLFSVCPAAAHDESDEVLMNPVDDYGSVGSAVHAACAELVTEDKADLGCIGQGYELDSAQMKELEILYAIARRFWSEYGPQFGTVRVEAEMQHKDADGNTWSGHQDVIGEQDSTCRVLDWKTTRLEAVNYRPQMMQYLWLVRHAAVPGSPGKNAERFQYAICFLRDKTVEVSSLFTAEQVDAWYAEYVKKIKEWDGRTYNPGGHCWYCSRRATCSGLCRDLSNVTLALACAGAEQAIADLSDNSKVNLWERIGVAEKFLANAREILKMHAQTNGGTIRGNGKSLVLRESIEKEIMPLPAWPILTAKVSPEAIAPCMSFRKNTSKAGSGILDIIAADAPKGGKKRAKDMLMEELEAAGAIETKKKIVPRIVAALPAATEKEIADGELQEQSQTSDMR